jgi:hypothetical protein
VEKARTKANCGNSWKRFTLLDVCAFILALGIGMKLAPSFHSQGSPPVLPQSTAEWAAMALITGSAIAGPLTLGAQWLIKGRRTSLSMGEWLWLTPSVCYSILIPLSQMSPSPTWLVPVLLVHCGNLACSVHLLIIEPVGRLRYSWSPRRAPPCLWSDKLGALVSGAIGVYVLADLLYLDPM